jgi:catechol 2,3-dioxygenase-like lactoylglutathione lyase family enzyme
MKINLASVFVDDQDKALSFYTETLGFVKKTEMPAGEFKWLPWCRQTTPTESSSCWSHPITPP